MKIAMRTFAKAPAGISVRRRNLGLRLALGALLAVPALATPPNRNLTGIWEDAAGNLLRVEQRGSAVVGVVTVPTPEAVRYGFKVGDTTFRGTLSERALRGKIHLHYEDPTVRTRCPAQWDAWTDLQLTVDDSANTLVGTYASTKIDADCVVSVGDPAQVDWYLFRPLVLENVVIEGFSDDTAKAKVIEPELPRFFVSARGHLSVDLAPDIKTRGAILEVQLVHGEDIALTVPLETRALSPNQASEGRWITLDLHDLAAGKFGEAYTNTVPPPDISGRNLFSETEPFNFRLRFRGDTTDVATSPPVDRFRLLELMEDRAEWLSRTLFRLPLTTARNFTADLRKKMAWRHFVEYRRPDITVLARNRGEIASFANEQVRLYVLYDSVTWPSRWEKVDSMRVDLGPGEEMEVLLRVDSLVRWNFDRLAAFRGLQLVAIDDSVMLREMADNVVSQRRMFKIDSLDPRKAAARLILDRVTDRDTVAAAARFLADEPFGPGDAGSVPFRRAKRTAREWADMIEEFENLEELKNSAFATEELGRLHDAMNEAAQTDSLHVGLPISSGPGPSFDVRPGTPVPGVDRTEYVLALPNWERFKAFAIALGSGGVATGEVPLPDSVPEHRLSSIDERRGGLLYSGWRRPTGHVDRFYHLSPHELQALANSLDLEHPLDMVKGEAVEALSSRHVGQRLAAELRATGRRVMYLDGSQLREYSFNYSTGKLEGPGSKVADGLVMLGRGNLVGIEHTLEVKSGNAGVDDAPDQLRNHERRLRESGVAVVDPTPEQVEFFSRYGARVVVKDQVGERKNVQVLFIPRERLTGSTVAGGGRELVITEDVAAPRNMGGARLHRVPASREAATTYAMELMAMRGMDPIAWNDPRLGREAYEQFYNNLVRTLGIPADNLVSRAERDRRFARGERLNPQGEWVDIFRGPLRNTDPYMSEEDHTRRYFQTVKHPSKSDAEARQAYREGYRYNSVSGWHKPDHLIDPHSRAVSRDEALELWKTMTRTTDLAAIATARRRIQNNEVWDPTVAGPDKWVRRTPEPIAWDADRQIERWSRWAANDPEFQKLTPAQQKERLDQARAEASQGKVWNRSGSRWVQPNEARPAPRPPPRWYRRVAPGSPQGAAAAQLAIDVLNASLQEAGRVGALRLKVITCRIKSSSRTDMWIGVQRGTLVREDIVWEPGFRDPTVQKALLEGWYRSSSGLWHSGGVPPWLAGARPNGTGDRCR